MGQQNKGMEVEEVVFHKERGKYYVANRAEEVPKDKVTKCGQFYWKDRHDGDKDYA